MIFNDLIRRSRIIEAGQKIGSSYAQFAPKKNRGKKREAAMRSALHYLDRESRTVTKEMGLGIYGKARLVKSIQSGMEDSELPNDLTHDIIKSLTKRVVGW